MTADDVKAIKDMAEAKGFKGEMKQDSWEFVSASWVYWTEKILKPMGFVKGQIVKVAKMYDKFVDKLSDYPWGIIEHADENGKVWVKMLEDCGNPSYVPASKLIAAPYVPHYFKPGDLVGFINYSGLRPVAIRNANIIGGTVIKINKDTLTLGFGNIDETLTVNKDDCFWTGYPLINRYGLREGELEKGAWVPKKK